MDINKIDDLLQLLDESRSHGQGTAGLQGLHDNYLITILSTNKNRDKYLKNYSGIKNEIIAVDNVIFIKDHIKDNIVILDVDLQVRVLKELKKSLIRIKELEDEWS